MEVIIMYLIGIDIAKYNHQCFIATEAGEVINEFSFDNNQAGFNELLKSLKSLDQSQQIKIGLEETGHYGNTLKQFISAMVTPSLNLTLILQNSFSNLPQLE